MAKRAKTTSNNRRDVTASKLRRRSLFETLEPRHLMATYGVEKISDASEVWTEHPDDRPAVAGKFRFYRDSTGPQQQVTLSLQVEQSAGLVAAELGNWSLIDSNGVTSRQAYFHTGFAAGSNFVDVTLIPLDDTHWEHDEFLKLTILDVGQYGTPLGYSVDPLKPSATMNIVDGDRPVAWMSAISTAGVDSTAPIWNAIDSSDPNAGLIKQEIVVSEGQSPAGKVIFHRTKADSGKKSIFRFQATGTAIHSADFTLYSASNTPHGFDPNTGMGWIEFPDGAYEAHLEYRTTSDGATGEAAEQTTFELLPSDNVSAFMQYDLTGYAPHRKVQLDLRESDDIPTFSISAVANTAVEGQGGTLAVPGTFRVSRSGDGLMEAAYNVKVTVSGSVSAADGWSSPALVHGAVNPTHFLNLRFPANATYVDFNFNPTDDSLWEVDEQLTVTLNVVSGAYNIGSPAAATVNLVDSDRPVVYISRVQALGVDTSAPLTDGLNAGDPNAVAIKQEAVISEGQAGRIYFSRTNAIGGNVTKVRFQVSGNASHGSDFTVSPHSSIPNALTFDPVSGIGVLDFTGAGSIYLDFFVAADSVNEGFERTTFTLLPGVGVGGVYDVTNFQPHKQASFDILESDDLPTFNVAAVVPTAIEGQGGSNPSAPVAGVFRFTRSGDGLVEAAYNVSITTSGTAAAADGYSSPVLVHAAVNPTHYLNLRFPANATFVDVAFNPVDDSLWELEEQLTITLNGVSGAYLVGAASVATVTVVDRDRPFVFMEAISSTGANTSWAIYDAINAGDPNMGLQRQEAFVAEGQSGRILFKRSAANEMIRTLFSFSGSATFNSDYNFSSPNLYSYNTSIATGTMEFPVGVYEVYLDYTTVGDATDEPAERTTFSLLPSNGIGINQKYDLTPYQPHRQAIFDLMEPNDVPTISVSAQAPNAFEGEGASPTVPGVFRFTRSGDGLVEAAYNVGVTVSGAVSGADGSSSPVLVHSAVNPSHYLNLRFPVGVTYVDVTFNPFNDTLWEDTEALTVTLNPSGGAYNLGAQTSATVNVADGDEQYIWMHALSSTGIDTHDPIDYAYTVGDPLIAQMTQAIVVGEGQNYAARLKVLRTIPGEVDTYVQVSVAATAVYGTDFTLTGTSLVSFNSTTGLAVIKIPANTFETYIDYVTLADGNGEAAESTTFSILPATNSGPTNKYNLTTLVPHRTVRVDVLEASTLPTFSVTSQSPSATAYEGQASASPPLAATPATFRITRSGDGLGAATYNVKITTSGTVAPEDGSSSPILLSNAGSKTHFLNLHFAASATYVDVTFNPADDSLWELDEQLTIAIEDVSGAYLVNSSQRTATTTLVDRDRPFVWMHAVSHLGVDTSAPVWDAINAGEDTENSIVQAAVVGEGQSQAGRIWFKRSDASQMIRARFAFSGSATYGSDFTIAGPNLFSIDTVAGTGYVEFPLGVDLVYLDYQTLTDALNESPERTVISLLPSNGIGQFQKYDLPGYVPHRSVTLDLIEPDDLPTFGVALADPAPAIEGNNSIGAVPKSFRFTRTGDGLIDATYNIKVTSSGTFSGADGTSSPLLIHSAIPATHYLNLHFPANASFVDVALNPVDDSGDEEDESLTMTIEPTAGAYNVGTSSAATMTVYDGEGIDLPLLRVNTVDHAAEDGETPGRVRFTRTYDIGALDLTVETRTYDNGQSLVVGAFNVHFAHGQSTVDYDIAVIDDNIVDPGSFIAVTIAATSPSVITTTPSQMTWGFYTNGEHDVVNIADNDVAPAASARTCPHCPVQEGPIDAASAVPAAGEPSTSTQPIRYSDGTVYISSTDLTSDGFGTPWGITRQWTNGKGYARGTVLGKGMVIAEQPQLIQVNGGTSALGIVIDGRSARYFHLNGGIYESDGFEQDTITYNSGNDVYTLTSSGGAKFSFYGFGSSRPYRQQGQFKSYADLAGNLTEVVSHTADGKIQEILRTANDGSGFKESFLYSYITGPTNKGLASSIELRRQYISEAWVTIRKAEYSYYGRDDANGNLNDLKTVLIKDSLGQVIDTTYYRYYLPGAMNGYAGGLKYVLYSDSVERVRAATSLEPSQVSDSVLAVYADQYLEYDSQQRATKEIVQGAGCSSCSNGQGAYTFAYTTSANSQGYNSWKTKTIETLPDGNQNIVFTNFQGQIMLKVYRDTSTQVEWGTYYQYDSAGRVITRANPSAVSGFSESLPDLIGFNSSTGDFTYLRNNAGLITAFQYYASTTATTSAAGGVAGYMSTIVIREGDLGAIVPQSSTSYIAAQAGGATIYLPAVETAYSDDAGLDPLSTTLEYVFHTGTLAVQSQTVTPPSGAQDAETHVYDTYGRLRWQKDAEGFLHYFEYDVATGALTKMIADVDTTKSGFVDKPTGWSTLVDAGIHAVTLYRVDRLGRTTKQTDPEGRVTFIVYKDAKQEVRVYSGWDSVTNQPTGPTQVMRYDRRGSYSETMTLGPGASITNNEPNGNEAIFYVTSLSRTLFNSAGQAIQTDDYVGIKSFAYPVYLINGVQNTHFFRTAYGYDDRGRLSKTTRPDGVIYRTVYDGQDRPVSEWIGTNDTPSSGFWSPSNPAGMDREKTYVYDDGGVGDSHLTSSGDALDQVTLLTYDYRRRVLTATLPDPDGAGAQLASSFHYTYDNLDRTVSQTDALGNVTGYLYEDASNRATVTSPDPDGAGPLLSLQSVSVYSGLGQLLSETEQISALNVNGTTNYEYDGIGRLKKVTEADPDDSGLLASPRTLYAYDKAGNLRFTTDALDSVTEFQYDKAGRLVTRIDADPDGAGSLLAPQLNYSYDVAGRLASITDPITSAFARVTSFEYDDLGRLIKLTQPDPDGAGTAARPILSYTYDRVGRMLTSSDSMSNVTSYGYDIRDNQTAAISADPDGVGPLSALITSWIFDAASRMTSATTPVGTTTYSYDAMNRMIGVTLPDPDGVGSLAAPTMSHTYDAMSNRKSLTDPRGKTTNYAYDNVYRLVEELQPDPDGSGALTRPTTSYDYTNFGDLAGLIDPDGNTTSWLYDRLHRATSETNELIAVRTFKYDALGQLAEKVDRLGRTTKYEYDALHRNTAEKWYDSGSNVINTIAYGYDAAGELTSATDSNGSYAYSYDGLGRQTNETQSMAGLSPQIIFASAYDAMGNRTSLAASLGGTGDFLNAYQYDHLHRMTAITQQGQSGGNAVAEKLVDLGYDNKGQLASLQRYADVAKAKHVATSHYGYDSMGRLTSLIHSKSTATPTGFDSNSLAGYKYTFDVASRIDSIDSLIDGLTQYGHDDTDQLIAADHISQTDESYSYDENGNRTMSGYTVGTNNRVSTDGTYNYTYDDEGNLLTKTAISSGAKEEYAWDYRNRLTKVTLKDSGGTVLKTVDQSYDAFNRWIRSVTDPDGPGVASAKNRFFIYEDGQIVYQFDGASASDLTDRTLWGPNVDQIFADEQVSSLSSAGSVIWPLTDHLNTARDLATYNSGTSTTTVANHRIYNSFGSLLNETNNGVSIIFGFTARPFDLQTGLQNNWNRWYISVLGVWASEDPIEFDAGDTNLRRAVSNQPTIATDPNGLEGGFIYGLYEGAESSARKYSPLYGFGTAFYDDGLWGVGSHYVNNWIPMVGFYRMGRGYYDSWGSDDGVIYYHFSNVAGMAPVVRAADAIERGDSRALGRTCSEAGMDALATAGPLVAAKYISPKTPITLRGGAPVESTARVPSPLAHVLDGHGPQQGFTGVFDMSTGQMLLKPSTRGAQVPNGWVSRGGGHADVSKALGGSSANHVGFAVIIQEDGALTITWRSGTLNSPPHFTVPTSLQPTIVEAVKSQTGRAVKCP